MKYKIGLFQYYFFILTSHVIINGEESDNVYLVFLLLHDVYSLVLLFLPFFVLSLVDSFDIC